MANKFLAAAGTKIFYGELNVADPATRLANIKAYGDLPAPSVKKIDTTRQDQDDETADDGIDWWEQCEPGTIDPGTLSFDIGMDEDQVETVYGLLRKKKNWKVAFKSGAKLLFTGYISIPKLQAKQGDEVIMTITIQCSGKVKFEKAVAAGKAKKAAKPVAESSAPVADAAAATSAPSA